MPVDYISQALYSHSDQMSDHFEDEETKLSAEGYTTEDLGLISVGICPGCYLTISCDFGNEEDTREAQILAHLRQCKLTEKVLEDRKNLDAALDAEAAAAAAVHGFEGVPMRKSCQQPGPLVQWEDENSDDAAAAGAQSPTRD